MIKDLDNNSDEYINYVIITLERICDKILIGNLECISKKILDDQVIEGPIISKNQDSAPISYVTCKIMEA